MRSGRDHADAAAVVVVAELHDRALAELPLDLAERHVERLATFLEVTLGVLCHHRLLLLGSCSWTWEVVGLVTSLIRLGHRNGGV